MGLNLGTVLTLALLLGKVLLLCPHLHLETLTLDVVGSVLPSVRQVTLATCRVSRHYGLVLLALKSLSVHVLDLRCGLCLRCSVRSLYRRLSQTDS